jgi:hypothetical protein
MASHDIDWTPGAHVRFGSLDFIVTTEGELVRAPAPQPPPTTGLDVIVRALKELQLSAPEARAPKHDQLLDFDFGKLEHQLTVYLGPHPSWEDLCALTFFFVNIMTQLAGGEPLSPDVMTQGASMAFPYGLRNAAQIVERHMALHSCPMPANDESLWAWPTTLWNRSMTSSQAIQSWSLALSSARGAITPRGSVLW